MSKPSVSIADSTLIVPSSLILSTATRRKVTVLAAVAVALIATNLLTLLVLLFTHFTASAPSAPYSVPMGQRDVACVQVLRNGGVPEDCSRMYHLDFYP